MEPTPTNPVHKPIEPEILYEIRLSWQIAVFFIVIGILGTAFIARGWR